MAVQAIFEFKNADSTLDLNNRFNGLFSRGIFYGGTVSPGSGLSISISPFFAVSYDGMVLREESVSTTLTVSAGIKSYIVLRAKYSGSEVPTLSFESIGSSAYLIDPDKNYLIVFATVTLAASVTSVVVGNIKTNERDIIDKIGRSTIRGLLTNPPTVSGSDRVGDTYIVAPGLGQPSSIYTFDGYNFIDISGTTLNNMVLKHRGNGFHSPRIEQHLSDEEKAAAVGTSGTPSTTNKFVTNIDPRIPTINEKNALVGSYGSPSSTNKYMTEETIIAAPSEVTFSASGYQLTLNVATYGPFYVGKNASGTAQNWFKIYLTNYSNYEYENSLGQKVQITGVYKDPFNQVNPASDADSNGFFNNNIILKFNYITDNSFVLVYGKKSTLGTLPKQSFIARTPWSAMVNSRVHFLLDQLKETHMSVDIPANETLPALLGASTQIREYLGTSFDIDTVVDGDSYDNLSKISDFSSSFVKNVGLLSTGNKNPRNINLSNMQTVYGSEIVTTDKVVMLNDEFSDNENWPAYRILSPINDNRVRVYGSWNNEVDHFTNKPVSDDYASMKLTFYGTGLDVLTNLRSDISHISQQTDNGKTGSIDPTYSGDASSVLSNQNYKANVPVFITGGLPIGVHTVDLGISNATGSFELHGFRIRGETGSFQELPGRIFSAGKLASFDGATSWAPSSTIGLYGRGGKLTRYVDRSFNAKKVNVINNIKSYRAVNGVSTLGSTTITNLTATSDIKVGDIVLISMFSGATLQYNIVESKPSATNVVMQYPLIDSSVGVTITLYCRTTSGVILGHTGSANDTEEVTARLDPLNFKAGRSDDLGSLSAGITSDAAFTLEDNLTSIVVKDFRLGTIDGRVSSGTITPLNFQSSGVASDGIANGDYFVVNDGTSNITFEMSASGSFVIPGSVHIAVNYSDDASTMQSKIIQAVNTTTNITAVDGNGVNVVISNKNVGSYNTPITQSISFGFSMYPIGMSDGSSADNISKDECIIGSGSNSFFRITFLGTGLDLVTANTSIPGITGDKSVKIDGIQIVSSGYVNIPYRGMTRVPVCSNLPYGTHTVEIGSDGLAVAYVLIYEVSNIVDGSKLTDVVKTSDFYNNYGVSGAKDANTSNSSGVITHTGTREIRYVGLSGWTREALSLSRAPKSGFIFKTNQLNSYCELDAWCTGFEFVYPKDTVSGYVTVYIDGILATATNFPTALFGSNINSATGRINQYGLTSAGNKASITVLPLGFHTIKIVQTEAGKYLNVELINVITDYAASRIEINEDCQHRIESVSTLRDTRTLSIFKTDNDISVDDMSDYAKINENEIITSEYTWSRSSGYSCISTKRSTDGYLRYSIDTDGNMSWGNGKSASQVSVRRIDSVGTFGEALQINGIVGTDSSFNVMSTGQSLIYGAAPELRFYETDSTSGRRAWNVSLSSEIFKFSLYDDSYTSSVSVFSIDPYASSPSPVGSTVVTLRPATTNSLINPIFELYNPIDTVSGLLGSIDWSYGSTKKKLGRISMSATGVSSNNADFLVYNSFNGGLIKTASLTSAGDAWIHSRLGIGSGATIPAYALHIEENTSISAYIRSAVGSASVVINSATNNNSVLSYQINNYTYASMGYYNPPATTPYFTFWCNNNINFQVGSGSNTAFLSTSGCFWSQNKIGVGSIASSFSSSYLLNVATTSAVQVGFNSSTSSSNIDVYAAYGNLSSIFFGTYGGSIRAALATSGTDLNLLNYSANNIYLGTSSTTQWRFLNSGDMEVLSGNIKSLNGNIYTSSILSVGSGSDAITPTGNHDFIINSSVANTKFRNQSDNNSSFVELDCAVGATDYIDFYAGHTYRAGISYNHSSTTMAVDAVYFSVGSFFRLDTLTGRSHTYGQLIVSDDFSKNGYDLYITKASNVSTHTESRTGNVTNYLTCTGALNSIYTYYRKTIGLSTSTIASNYVDSTYYGFDSGSLTFKWQTLSGSMIFNTSAQLLVPQVAIGNSYGSIDSTLISYVSGYHQVRFGSATNNNYVIMECASTFYNGIYFKSSSVNNMYLVSTSTGAAALSSTLSMTVQSVSTSIIGSSTISLTAPSMYMAGNMYPTADSTYDIGSSSLYFKKIYSDTIVTNNNGGFLFNSSENYLSVNGVTVNASSYFDVDAGMYGLFIINVRPYGGSIVYHIIASVTYADTTTKYYAAAASRNYNYQTTNIDLDFYVKGAGMALSFINNTLSNCYVTILGLGKLL
jgi:hypothetical protein